MKQPLEPIIVDLFAGGGGASQAIFEALGVHPDVAVNHNAEAIATHTANHPTTRHYQCDVHEVDPIEACTFDGALRPVDILWASPDCTHFSKARGGKPVEKRIRSLADVVLVWVDKLAAAGNMHPRMILLENVEEFQDWGPVLENGKPCPEKKGLDFRRWVKGLEDAGYKVGWEELVAADFGAPTTRKRLFLVARRDGGEIRWPAATHVSRKAQRDLFDQRPHWKSAASIIDFTREIPSIFTRKRPLQPKTHKRIARGIERFVIRSPNPFIVPVTHTKGGNTAREGTQPLPTITTAKGGELAIAAPVLVPRYGEREGQAPRVLDTQQPYPTAVPTGNGGDIAATFLQKMAQNGIGTNMGDPLLAAMAQAPRHYQVAAHLTRQFGSTVSGRDLNDAHPTVMTDGDGGKSGIVAASMIQHNGDRVGREAQEPLTALTERSTQQQLMGVSMDAYYSTGRPATPDRPLRAATAKARHGVNAAYMEQANTGMVGHEATSPVSTIVEKGCTQRLVEARMAEMGAEPGSLRLKVLEFLWEHFGQPTDAEWENPLATIEARLKFGLVIIEDTIWQIVDIGMRMLTPRELFNAQGFPPSYIINVEIEKVDKRGNVRRIPMTKTAQIAQAGNSVSPPPAIALIRANVDWRELPERVAA